MKTLTFKAYLTGATTICALLFLAAGPAQANAPSTVPFSQSFETNNVNDTIVDGNGWYAGASSFATVTNKSYTLSGYPIKGPHANVVVLDTEYSAITNQISNYGTGSKIWLDTVVQFTQWTDETPPDLTDPSIQIAVWVNGTNGNLMVYHSYELDPFGPSTVSRISQITNVMNLTSDTWARVTIEKDVASDTTFFPCFFKIYLNGITVTNDYAYKDPSDPWTGPPYYGGYGGTWFGSVDAFNVNDQVSSISFSGTGFFDDFVVTNGVVVFSTLWTISPVLNIAHGGTISPSTAFTVNDGDSTSITVTASAFWTNISYVADGTVTPLANGTNYVYTFSSISADHTFTANVAQITVTNSGVSVPSWWLNQYGSYASPNASHVTADLDNDGMLNWEEWWASTDPNNSNSVFAISAHYVSNGTTYVEWVTTAIDPDLAGIPFRVDRRTNLLLTAWTEAYGTKSRAAGTNRWAETAPPAGAPAFYRIVVTN